MQAVSPLWATIIILGVVAVNAYVAFKKAAFDALNEAVIKRMEKEEIHRVEVLKKIYETTESYINPFDVYHTMISMFMGIASYNLIFLRFHDWIVKTEPIGHNPVLVVICNMIVCVIVLYLYILFGYQIPMRVGTKNSSKAVLKQMQLVHAAFILIKPITFLLEVIIRFSITLFKGNPEEYEENLTEEEILSMVNEGQEQGVLEASDAEMISNIFDFSEKEARDIMTPKIRMVTVNAEQSLLQALELMLDENYTRYPLYEENRDNIIGILYLKDVVDYYVRKRNKKVSLKDIAREPYFVPDTQNIKVLFHELRRRKIHMAIAIDEYGQTAGLVSMEDILEEIVGNIQDEYDEEEREITPVGDNTYLVKGYTALDDLQDEIGIQVDTEDFDTVNGLLISLLSRIPNDQETETVDFKGYHFEILEIKNKVIELVKITKIEEPDLPDKTESLALD